MLHEISRECDDLEEAYEDANTDSQKKKILRERADLMEARKSLYLLATNKEEDYFENKIDKDVLFKNFKKKVESIKKTEDFEKEYWDKWCDAASSDWKFNKTTGKPEYQGSAVSDKVKLEKEAENFGKDDLKKLIEVYKHKRNYRIEFDSGNITEIKNPEGEDIMIEVGDFKKKILGTKKNFREVLRGLEKYNSKKYSEKNVKQEIEEMLLETADVEEVLKHMETLLDPTTPIPERRNIREALKELLELRKINDEISENDLLEKVKENIKIEYENLRKKVTSDILARKVSLDKEDKEILEKVAARTAEVKKDTTIDLEEVIKKIQVIFDKLQGKFWGGRTKARTLQKRRGYGKRELNWLFRESKIGIGGPEIRDFMNSKSEEELEEALRDRVKFVSLVVELIKTEIKK